MPWNEGSDGEHDGTSTNEGNDEDVGCDRSDQWLADFARVRRSNYLNRGTSMSTHVSTNQH